MKLKQRYHLNFAFHYIICKLNATTTSLMQEYKEKDAEEQKELLKKGISFVSQYINDYAECGKFQDNTIYDSNGIKVAAVLVNMQIIGYDWNEYVNVPDVGLMEIEWNMTRYGILEHINQLNSFADAGSYRAFIEPQLEKLVGNDSEKLILLKKILDGEQAL